MGLKALSSTRASFLAGTAILCASLLIPVAASGHSVGFVYNDLLAHPQYHVQVVDELVPLSAIGTERLQQGNLHHQQPHLETTPQIEMVKDEPQDRSKDDQNQAESGENSNGQLPAPGSKPASSMVMTDAKGQRWACSIPEAHIEEVKPEPEKTPQEIEEEKQKSIQRGLALLDHLTGRCLLTNFGYWTYEYCHKRRIRQYHAHNVNGKWEPVSEAATHVLATYQPFSTDAQGQPELDGSVEQSKSPSSSEKRVATTTDLGISNERKYLVQHWNYGEICDLTNVFRKVEVQFQCANFDDRIQQASEPSTCTYIIVIYSSALCEDEAFELIPAPEANKINCRHIVTDEQYQQHKASVPEAIDGGLGSLTAHKSDEQTKLGQSISQEGAGTLVDKTPTAGAKLTAGFMASLIDEIETADRQKQLSEFWADIKRYFDALKPSMTKDQKDALERTLQAQDVDSLLEIIFGRKSGVTGKAKDKRAEPGEDAGQNVKSTSNKMDHVNLFQHFLNALNKEDKEALTESADKKGGDRNGMVPNEADEVLAMDLAVLLDILDDATKRAGSAEEGKVDNKEKDRRKEMGL
ncbi:Protein OS-9 [Mortierella claussenii]|nr:Protein OS-9 [Mortierella claussenii]